jgi:hypothetical protein
MNSIPFNLILALTILSLSNAQPMDDSVPPSVEIISSEAPILVETQPLDHQTVVDESPLQTSIDTPSKPTLVLKLKNFISNHSLAVASTCSAIGGFIIGYLSKSNPIIQPIPKPTTHNQTQTESSTQNNIETQTEPSILDSKKSFENINLEIDDQAKPNKPIIHNHTQTESPIVDPKKTFKTVRFEDGINPSNMTSPLNLPPVIINQPIPNINEIVKPILTVNTSLSYESKSNPVSVSSNISSSNRGGGDDNNYEESTNFSSTCSSPTSTLSQADDQYSSIFNDLSYQLSKQENNKRWSKFIGLCSSNESMLSQWFSHKLSGNIRNSIGNAYWETLNDAVDQLKKTSKPLDLTHEFNSYKAAILDEDENGVTSIIQTQYGNCLPSKIKK